jgi:NADPH-dependent curcumin reductase CurA
MNRRIVLARYPDGLPGTDDFRVEAVAMPQPAEGEVLVAVSHLSMDPFPRLRMRADSRAGPPMPLGATVGGRGVGQVIASRHPDWPEGSWLHGELGWAGYVALDPQGCERIDLHLGPPERHLSVLGPSGLTAYMVTVALGAVQAGETMAFAPAAGSVGTIAGQIARARGARTIGLAGKTQLATLTGYDEALDHDAQGALAACDLVVDGVGGAVHEALIAALKPRGRAILLGFIGGYNDAAPPRYGNAMPVLMKRARMEGFLLADWRDRFDEARVALSEWLADGSIVPVETIWHGLDQAPAAFAALFGDAPPGKQIVSVGDDK